MQKVMMTLKMLLEISPVLIMKGIKNLRKLLNNEMELLTI